jgi:DNA (cytosine-5)-methyltransferase 1
MTRGLHKVIRAIIFVKLPPKQSLMRFAEFFAGIGLVRMGLESAGWSVAFANDIDPLKALLYQSHYPPSDDTFLLGDIHELDASVVPDIDLATASFPCTDLSLAGSRRGLSGSQSSAFWGFTRVLEELGGRRPPLVLLENVPGFLTSHNGKDFTDALLALNRLGYAVDAFMVDALHFVPQSRLRLFIVGSHWLPTAIDEGQLLFYQSAIRPPQLASFIFSHPEINWRIQELPPLPKPKNNLSAILEDLNPASEEWWSQARVDYLINQMSPRHAQKLMEMKHAPQFSYGTVFRRIRQGKSMAELRTDGIAGCLRTPKGGSARQILVRAGQGEVSVRLLTPCECARLMGADNFTITGSPNQALFGFGDAVCVPVITWIAENYLNPLLYQIKAQYEQNVYESV